MTGERLRHLIEEGEPAGTRGPSDPTDAALRDLAAALNIAATASPSPSPAPEQAEREAAAVAAFRSARTASAAAGRMRRGALRDHLSRARTVVLAGVAAAVLGGGAAVAAAGGGVPFVGDDADSAAQPSAPAPEDVGPTASATSFGPADATAAAPAASPTGEDERPSAVPGSASPGDAEATPDAAANANEQALHAMCTARARNPHLAPPALITATGGRDRIHAYCNDLLATPSPHPTPGADGDRRNHAPPTADADEGKGEGEGEGKKAPWLPSPWSSASETAPPLM